MNKWPIALILFAFIVVICTFGHCDKDEEITVKDYTTTIQYDPNITITITDPNEQWELSWAETKDLSGRTVFVENATPIALLTVQPCEQGGFYIPNPRVHGDIEITCDGNEITVVFDNCGPLDIFAMLHKGLCPDCNAVWTDKANWQCIGE